MGTRTVSLLEQKKIQWAKEKEEMVGMCGLWGRMANDRRFYDENSRPSIRTHYVSSIELSNPCEANVDSSELPFEERNKYPFRRRSPSLPPIYKTSNYQQKEVELERERYCDGEEGETSGYASDSGGGVDYQQNESRGWVQKRINSHNNEWQYTTCMNTPDSLNSACSIDNGRPKWGDKGVGVGHLWTPTPHNPDARLPEVGDRSGATPPAWLNRAQKFSEPAQVLVINHPDMSTGTDFGGSCETINSADYSNRTFLRGQNIPLEPDILVEREKKRQKALEHQQAIRQQLEERERKRKEERERRLREERQEEERIRREQETERRRVEDEERRQREREEKAERKAEAMREALENAERQAREDKIRARHKHSLDKIDLNESMRKVHLEEPEEKQLDRSLEKEKEEVPVSSSADVMIVERRDSQSDETECSILLEEESQLALVLDSPQEISANQLSLVISPGRLLTPSKFRTQRVNEKSTQTDFKSETNGTHHQCKLPLRCRSQPRLEDRPKWGVNRPDTQYIKQSERDPYYQNRVRRNVSRVRSKSTKHNEREESRSPSPLNNSKTPHSSSGSVNSTGTTKIPVSKATKSTLTPRIMQMVISSTNTIRKTSASRPRYLSVKGAVIAGNSLRQKISRLQQQQTVREPVLVSVKDVLDQLSSLRQGLTLKQQEWDISRSPTPFSEISS